MVSDARLSEISRMDCADLVPSDLHKFYDFREWRNPCAVLSVAFPNEWADILSVLKEFRILRTDICEAGTKGGCKSLVAIRMDQMFLAKGSLALASLNHACRDHVPTFPQRSLPRLLTAAACGGLGAAPDHRTRRALLHLSNSCASPCGPAMLVTHDPTSDIVLVHDRSGRVVGWAPANKKRPPELLGQWAADDTRTPPNVLEALAMLPPAIWYKRRPQLADRHVVKIVNRAGDVSKYPAEFWHSLYDRPWVVPDTDMPITNSAHSSYQLVRVKALRNPLMPAAMLNALSGHRSVEIRCLVAENTATPPETLATLAYDPC